MHASTSSSGLAKLNFGLACILTGVAAGRAVGQETPSQLVDFPYTSNTTIGSATPMSYRISPTNTTAVALAAFVENLAGRQSAFDPDIAEIVRAGWDELFD